MSDFGADIFDLNPPPPPTPPEGGDGKRKSAPRSRKPRKAVAAEPAAEAAPAPAAAQVTGRDEAEAKPAPAEPAPQKTRRRRKAEPTNDDVAAVVGEPKTRRRRRATGIPAEAPAAELQAPAGDSVEAPIEAPRQPDAAESAPARLAFAHEPKLERWTLRHHHGIVATAGEKNVRVAVMLDLHPLQEAARSRGAELSFRKLLRHLAGERRILRALCYLLEGTPRPAAGAIAASGFEVHVLPSADAIAERVRTDAKTLPAGVEVVVLAPGTEAQLRLASELEPQGMKVETANFDPTGRGGVPHRQLGRECVFVP